jgi:hypothetical protein
MDFRSAAAFAALLLAPIAVRGQELPPSAENWNLPPIGAEDDMPPEKSGWMVNSPLMRVGWPEFKMPEVHMPRLMSNRETGEPGLLSAPLTRAQQATRTVATKTRDAWNGTIDRVKLRLPGGGADDDQVASTEPRQRFWQSWFGAEPAGGESLSNQAPAVRVANEAPTTKLR